MEVDYGLSLSFLDFLAGFGRLAGGSSVGAGGWLGVGVTVGWRGGLCLG